MSKAQEILSKAAVIQEAKVEAVRVFDRKDKEGACKFFKGWTKKGYKVFSFDAGSDDHILAASKSKPSPKDVSAAAPSGQLPAKNMKFDAEISGPEFCE